jgi:predicted methyltransferase
MGLVVLSHIQAERLLDARRNEMGVVHISLDLNLSTVEVQITHEGVHTPDGQSIRWEDIQTIRKSENSCFLIEGSIVEKIRYYSDLRDQLYSLYPTEGAPTMLVSGIPMHRVKGTDPYRDTLEKIKTIKPVSGRVLDTATGLGYTAIEAAKTANQVITIELDMAALKVARHNPWSQTLFENRRISLVLGDSYEMVNSFERSSFDQIIHDPPTISLAGDLYAETFYSQLHCLLRTGGRLFHYIGDPQSRSGRNTTAGVIQRLRNAGFKRVKRAPRAFGVVAYR